MKVNRSVGVWAAFCMVGLCAGCGPREDAKLSEAASPENALGTPTASARQEERAAIPEEPLEAVVERGKAVYGRTCIACHQPDGKGIAKVFPPLAESDYLVENLDKIIRGVIYGQQGEMIVKGETYNLVMPPQMLNDRDTADVVTYVLNSFGNPGGRIEVERVKRLRELGP